MIPLFFLGDNGAEIQTTGCRGYPVPQNGVLIERTHPLKYCGCLVTAT